MFPFNVNPLSMAFGSGDDQKNNMAIMMAYQLGTQQQQQLAQPAQQQLPSPAAPMQQLHPRQQQQQQQQRRSNYGGAFHGSCFACGLPYHLQTKRCSEP